MHMSGMPPHGGGAMGHRMYVSPGELHPSVRVEPWVYQRLKQLEGRRIVIDTVRGSVSGVLVDVKPDHIAVQEGPGESLFLVRLCQIVWVMPNVD